MSFVYDPDDPERQGTLHETYRTLRDAYPVYHNPERRIWVLSRFEDVWSCLGDTETFASSGVEEARALLPMMIFEDPPRHGQLRALVSKAFTRQRVSEMEPQIRAVTRQLLDRSARDAHCELMHAFALQLPSIVIADLIGLPEERRGVVLAFTESMIEAGPQGSDIKQPAAAIYSEFAKLLAERRSEPRDDLMSALLEAEVDGQGLNDEELLGFCFHLIVAGNDTTANLIGNGSVLLAGHPEQREALVRNSAAIPNAVEEMLRFESPTQSLPRRPVREVELHGVRIPADVRLLVTFGAANRDEREFPEPDRFDITRAIPRHLAFGRGNHFCLGASLARLEARVAFEELLERFPHYALADAPVWAASRWARAHPEVRLRLHK